MSNKKQILHEIVGQTRPLPEVELRLQSHGYDEDIYAAYALDEPIGHMKLGRIGADDPFVIHSSYVHEQLQHRGYGLAMYLGAAAIAYDHGFRLTSDTMVSRDASAVWTRLQRHGVATIQEDFYYRGASETFSSRGRAQFIAPEELDNLRPQARLELIDDDIWQDAVKL